MMGKQLILLTRGGHVHKHLLSDDAALELRGVLERGSCADSRFTFWGGDETFVSFAIKDIEVIEVAHEHKSI